jgi:hypothetical protein
MCMMVACRATEPPRFRSDSDLPARKCDSSVTRLSIRDARALRRSIA